MMVVSGVLKPWLYLQETATLADRLVQDQVIRAQKEEEIYVLRRDLNTQKQQYLELQQLYETSVAELREYKEKVRDNETWK